MESPNPSMVRSLAPLTFYDPHVLIQSQTPQWVMRRGVTDRVIWGAIAASAQNVCAEMVEVDVMNAQLETGKLLLQRREQGHYGKLHHPFHDNPCLPPVGNSPLSVMGVLLSLDLRHEFTNSDTFGIAMEAISLRLEPRSRYGSPRGADGSGSKTGTAIYCPWWPRNCGEYGISLASWKGSVDGILSSSYMC